MVYAKKPILKSKSKLPPGKKVVGITMGDPAGIGPEVIAGTLNSSGFSLPRDTDCVVIGNASVFRLAGGKPGEGHVFIDITAQKSSHQPGKSSSASARDSLCYLEHAIQLLKDGRLSALVTGPVCKESIGQFLPGFRGHTTFLATEFSCKDVEMLFVAPGTKMLLVTRHIPLKDVACAISAKKISTVINTAALCLRHQFGIVAPRIAVCGLNPHAGENGHIGKEEQEHIIPAIRNLSRSGWDVQGPFPADTLFEPRISKNFDLLVTMYHDQGLPVLKAMHFDNLVNVTAGLPFVRTSPAHGTAFNIAGKRIASRGSMRAAIQLAFKMIL